MTIILIFLACVIIYILYIFINDRIISRQVDNSFKRVLAQAREISKTNKGIFLVEDIEGTYVCKGDNFYIGKSIKFPLYMRPDGIYTEVESEDYIYVGYCDGFKLYRDRDKTGGYGKFDRLGNHIIVERNDDYLYTKSYTSDAYYDTGDSGGYVADDSYSYNLRVDWRPDGSYGDIYERNGKQYDEWGNEL